MSKRTFDILFAAAGLVVLSPLLLCVAAAVKFTSAGPILFRQTRLGRHGAPFTMLKFRSMVAGAERSGAEVTAGGDLRITPLGRLLRRTKLDELPQLWNVLRGDMSFVGPRPEVPRFAARFPREFRRILAVRPGITHRATLAFRREEDILAQVRDPRRFYVERVMPYKLELYERHLRQSLLSDVLTILETVTPLKTTPAVVVGDLLDAPLVANIPAYEEAPLAPRVAAAPMAIAAAGGEDRVLLPTGTLRG